MKSADGEVVYVGKAKLLRARVSQYFQEETSDYRAFVGLLSKIITDIETVVTRSEKEALLVEREMIRRHEPRFNVIWRDDKQYLCLRVDTKHKWPRVEVTRRMKKDGARYFGPYHSASAARQTLRVINRHFQLRTCRDSVLNNRQRPCLEHQIGRCPAPCVLPADEGEYRESVDDVLLFLDGRADTLVERLEQRMWAAAEEQAYERAAHYRDQLRAVSKTMERQGVALSTLKDIDVLGFFREASDVCISVIEVRGGRVENIHTTLFEEQAGEDAELLSTFILQRASEMSSGKPAAELLVARELEDAEVLAEILTEERGGRVAVRHPQRGEGRKLLELALENAEHGFHEQRLKTGALERTLEGLKSRLGLTKLPVRIECYDISNLGAHLIVGAQVVFEKAAPAKNRYRKYRVKSTTGQDDFASMYEVLSRRFKRGLEERDLPDLVVIDGGKGQLEVARAVFRDLGVEGVDLVSLAKSRVVGRDDADGSRRSPERVFRPGAKEPIILPQTSPEVLLLARIRDEAHRFGITYHRELRRKARLRSGLEEIPGVGPTRRKALLRHFGSLKKIREASEEELAAAPGVGKAAAKTIREALRAMRSGEVEEVAEDEVQESKAGFDPSAMDRQPSG
ncbi:MAG: excinuclease ABC subunit UvrC [Myxococcota bacterium]